MCAIVAWTGSLVRILWVCRVSIVNAVASLLFFSLLVQAQNLMADLSSAGSPAEYVFWAGVFGFTFLLWAFPVHYAARRSLDQLVLTTPGQRPPYGLGWMVEWLPRLLGLAPFVALALGVRGAREAAWGAQDVLDAARLTVTQGLWLYVVDTVVAVVFVIAVYKRKAIFGSWDGKVLYPTALIATACIFAAAYVFPIWVSVHFPRAMLVPPLFGSLVLGASALTRLGDRTGIPFLATVALLFGAATGLNADFNVLRTLPNVNGDQRLTLEAAIKTWKTANHCTTSCPRPIIVAIDGGASRAAFAAATFVGELLDRMPAPADGEAATPGRRIFAISGVSGGSYGAAVIQAALADAQNRGDGMRPPCRSAQTTWFGYENWRKSDGRFTWRQCLQALTSGDYLSSTIIGLAFRDLAAPPWQKIGLPAMPDRAALLEMTWERQYAATLESGRTFYEGGAPCRTGEEGGLCRRMAHPAAFVTAASGPPRWMPLLLLNGTSVATGRRIVSSDLASVKDGDDDQPTGGALFSQAFDLREVMTDQCPHKPPSIDMSAVASTDALRDASQDSRTARTLTEGVCAETPAPVDGPDVRLSTAALTSARFPIISPAGIFAMQSTLYGDQVVDGGYFENSGLTTALDIVAALKRSGIDAAVVSISNNPAYDPPSDAQQAACDARFRQLNGSEARFSPANCTGLPRRPARTPLVPPIDDTFLGRFFGILWRPLQTLVATGDGHADEVTARIAAAPPPGGFYRLKVEVAPIFAADPAGQLAADPACDMMIGKTITMTKVSMSWWLAAAVQADLDIQRCSKSNRVELSHLVGALGDRITVP